MNRRRNRLAQALGLTLILAAAACAAPAEEDTGNGGLAATVNDSAAQDTQAELVALMSTDRDRVVEVEVHGDTHVCTVLSSRGDLASNLDFGKDDVVKVFLYRKSTFVLFNSDTGGSAAVGGSTEDALSADLDAIVADLGSSPTAAVRPRGVATAVASSGQRVLAGAIRGLASMVRKNLTQEITGATKALANPASETAEAIATASKGMSKYLSARLRTESVGTVLDIAGTDWKATLAKLTSIGVKTAYFGEDGAKKYLAAVSKDRTVMLMTHSGKLSDARLVQFPALRAYFDRGAEFMPKVMRLIAQQEKTQLRVIGGGTLEGGQVPVYRAVSQLQKEGVDVVADSIMAGPGAEYILAGKVAPSEHVLVQGLDWGGESATATLASKMGVLWGGGGQAKDEAIRLITAGKPVWVVRERAALKEVAGMPNAAADVEAAAADLLAKGQLTTAKMKLLHVFETWEELVSALEAAVP